ncbi:unnamed protein product [Symbiodinium natans]|uniref:Photosystem I reaction center subunit IX n=1 Tax=Symbiodinium natans TaxID=878477 RepID=A0A812LM79_9DINO|nr:unnamed protein product [Symbiodinium natans]
MARRPILAIALLGAALCYLGLTPGSSFIAPKSVQSSVEVQKGQLEGVALGLGAGLLTAEPAYANVWNDEILPYSVSISFAIIWGIILGFVLLRLQEAFPE